MGTPKVQDIVYIGLRPALTTPLVSPPSAGSPFPLWLQLVVTRTSQIARCWRDKAGRLHYALLESLCHIWLPLVKIAIIIILFTTIQEHDIVAVITCTKGVSLTAFKGLDEWLIVLCYLKCSTALYSKRHLWQAEKYWGLFFQELVT